MKERGVKKGGPRNGGSFCGYRSTNDVKLTKEITENNKTPKQD